MAIWYIDPTTVSESDAYDGGYGSGKLRDLYSDVSGLAAGDSIYFKSGTTHPGRCTLTTTGTAAAWITIGKYGGSSRAIIDAQGGSNGTACFLLNAVSYVRVSGLHGVNHTAASGAGITALRSSQIVIEDCEASANLVGIRVAQDQAATKSNIIVRRNTLHDNTYMGIYVACGDIAGAVIGDIDIEDNAVDRNGFSGAGVALSRGGIFVKSLYTSAIDATRDPYGVRVRRNTVRGNRGYGIAFSPVLSGGKENCIVDNEVTGQTPGEDDDTHCIWAGGSENVLIQGNHVHHNYGLLNGSAGSGVGIFIDQFTNGARCSNCRVIGNRVNDQWMGQTNANIPSAGIYFFHSLNGQCSGNEISRCRQGIVVLGENTADNTVGTRVHNNTIVDAQEGGLVAANYADDTIFRNNIVLRAALGIFVQTGSGAATNVSETKNAVYQADIALANGAWASPSMGSLDGADIAADLLLDASYRPLAGSPVIGTGTYLKSARHMGGKRMSPVRPDIGAYQYTEPRAIVLTRAV